MLTYHTEVKVRIYGGSVFQLKLFFTSFTEQSNMIQDQLWENKGWIDWPEYLIGAFRQCNHCSWQFTDGSAMTGKF